jgi:transcription antitermination factor NusG
VDSDAARSPVGESWPWFAIRVRSNFERKSADLLSQKGLEEFLPTYRRRTRWSDRTKFVERPLFPGYLFCRFDPQSWLPVLQTPGVVHVVGVGGKPEPINEVEIESLRKLVRSSLPLFPQAFLRVGQKVLIRDGPLAGVEGIMLQFEKNCRIVVSITLLQRSVAAEIDAEWVSGIQ